MMRLLPYALCIIVSVGISVLVTLNFMPIRFVTVDLHELLAHESQHLMKLPADKRVAQQENAAKRIDHALTFYSEQSGKGILVSKAVVKGMPDITIDIENLLDQ